MAFGAALWMQGNFNPLGVDSSKTPFPLIEAEVPYSLSVGIGGTLEQFPSALFPAYADTQLVHGVTVSTLDLSRSQAQEIGVRIPVDSPNLPTDYPGLTLPVHVDHDAVTVEAASVRVQALGGVLTEAEMRAVLTVAGWPEVLHSEALAVAFCESKWSPYAMGDGGNSIGLFQLNRLWFRYSGEDVEMWADAVTNARVALATYYYDLGRGYPAWTQWSCRKAVY